jgi:hypothetical protein
MQLTQVTQGVDPNNDIVIMFTYKPGGQNR